jgi:cysteine desulfurase
MGAQADEVFFTSGGTEGDNLAVLGVWRARRAHGRCAAVGTTVEHKAVLGALRQVAREGGEERLVSVTADGVVDEDSFEQHVTEEVGVCSVMWVNNEVGTIQRLASLGERARARGVVFHSDGVQAFGKCFIEARTQPFDLLTISGHKIGAPKGIGALFVRRGTPLEPLLHGGTQNRGLRPGTENVAFAVGLARAAELAVAERVAEGGRLRALRDALEAQLVGRIPDVVVHGRGAERAPHILNLSVPGTDSESLLMALDLAGVACSSGSACQSGNVEPSHVLMAMGVPRGLAVGTVRMSLGSLTTAECVDRVAQLFPTLITRARRLAGTAA